MHPMGLMATWSQIPNSTNKGNAAPLWQLTNGSEEGASELIKQLSPTLNVLHRTVVSFSLRRGGMVQHPPALRTPGTQPIWPDVVHTPHHLKASCKRAVQAQCASVVATLMAALILL